jgi:hypothetical protein
LLALHTFLGGKKKAPKQAKGSGGAGRQQLSLHNVERSQKPRKKALARFRSAADFILRLGPSEKGELRAH